MASATEAAGRALLAVGGLVRRAEVSTDGRTLHQIGGREADSFYRDRWSYDKVVRSTHGVNCTGSCSWKVYVKDGIITWEQQQTDYPSVGADRPEHEPRGCPRGAAFSWYTYSPTRVRYPYARGVLVEMYREAKARLGGDPVAALAMAMGHVILKEFFVAKTTPRFVDYVSRYTDLPYLIALEPLAGGGYRPGKFLTAADLGEVDPEAAFRPAVWDSATDAVAVPNGSLGHRFNAAGVGKWNLDLGEIAPRLSCAGGDAVEVVLPRFDNDTAELMRRGVPTAQVAGRVVTTLFDLMLAQYGVPRVYERLSVVMDRAGGAEHRRDLVAGLTGRVIEIGAGNGRTFAHYPTTVTEVLAVEPEPRLRAAALTAAATAPVPVRVVDGVAEALPARDGEFDAAVAALVLCTVPAQAAALAEIARVVRPGGQLRFFEHVAADTPGAMRTVQRIADATLWPRVFAGCRTGRDTVTAITSGGFTINEVRRFRFPPTGPSSPAAPHVRGTATRAADIPMAR